MNPLKRYLSAGLLVPLLVACTIKEDRSDCPDAGNGNGNGAHSLTIYFNYDPAADVEDEKAVEKIDIFVFDRQGVFQAEWPDNDPHHSPMTIPAPGLSAGNYRFIAWAAPRDAYTVSPAILTAGRTTFAEMELAILSHGDTLEYKPVFQVDTMVRILNQGDAQRMDLLFKPTYCTINLTLKNFPDPYNAHGMIINDTWNGKYKLDLSCVFNGMMLYIPFRSSYTAVGGELLSSFRISRLLTTDIADHRELILDIYDMVTHVRFSSMDMFLLLQDKVKHVVDYNAYTYDHIIDFDAP